LYRLVQKGAVVTLAISGITGPNVTKIVHNVQKFILFNILKSELQYSVRLEWQCNKGDWSAKNADILTLIGCHGKSLEESKKLHDLNKPLRSLPILKFL